MNKSKILIIEDDRTLCDGIVTVLRKAGYAVSAATDGAIGSRLFSEVRPDLVLTDLKLPEKSGLQLLQEFLAADATVPVIMISAFGTIDLAVNALKAGARDFIPKPFSIAELKNKVETALCGRTSETNGKAVAGFHGLIGSSPAMEQLFRQIRQVAPVDSPVLITGESGTGKELVARAIHAESRRRRQRFLAVNCGAFTDTLLESELFGHEQGAFTGAVRRHQGIFEQAHGGTILLDEIGEISMPMQIKLLRVLQQQTFMRLGGIEEITTDVRILAATNSDLRGAIEQKTFRDDLYFRLNVVPLGLPPLRERREDIPVLVKHIMEQKSRELGRPQPAIESEALVALQRYFWPGNIRELENFLERLLIFTSGDRITGADILLDTTGQSTSLNAGDDLNAVLAETETQMIRQALTKAQGVKQQAAKLLGIKTSTLYYKMEKYGIGDE